MNELQTQDKNVESTRGYAYIAPECDIIETDSEYQMIYDLPGIEKENISIKVEKDVLTVTAECKNAAEGYTLIGGEFAPTNYTRSFNLNNIVDTTKIQADYTDGTLKLTLPKKEEQKTKEIKINIA
jgi:HSP20 family protein